MAAMSASSDGGKAIIPYPAAMRLGGSNTVRSLTLYLKDSSLSSETVDNVKQLLDSAFNYRDSAYSIINLDSLLDTMNSITGMMTTMLAGIASIALLVGGIGIMNMMLVSVSERTTEIGLRKALGARPGLIQMQFLMESVMLSLMGRVHRHIDGQSRLVDDCNGAGYYLPAQRRRNHAGVRVFRLGRHSVRLGTRAQGFTAESY